MTDAGSSLAAAGITLRRIQPGTHRVAEQEAEAIRRPFVQAAEGVQDAFADTFRDIFDGGIKSFADLGRKIADIMKNAAAEIAAAMIFRPVIAPTLEGCSLSDLKESLA